VLETKILHLIRLETVQLCRSWPS